MKYISWGFSVIAFVAVLIFIPIICWQIYTSSVASSLETAESVSFEKSLPSFKSDLENSKLSQFVYIRNGDAYYVTVDLTAKTVNVEATMGFFSKVNVDANLDLATGKIDFKNNATDNEAYNLFSKIHSTDMYSIFEDLFGVSVLYGSDIKFAKEIDLYFVASASNMPQFTFRNKKLVSITTDDYTVTGITY